MYTWAVHVKRLLCTYDAPVWPRLTGLQTNLRHPWPTHVRIHTFKNPWSGDTKTPLCLGETHPFEDKNRLGSELLNFWTLTLRFGGIGCSVFACVHIYKKMCIYTHIRYTLRFRRRHWMFGICVPTWV